MDSLADLATRLDDAAAVLGGAGKRLTGPGPHGAAFGADAPGRMGELGRALQAEWERALGARAREAAVTAARLADAAQTLRVVAGGYADADDAARERQPQPGEA
jgi:hypothetical protein